MVQAAAAVPAEAKDENYVHHFLFVVGGVLTTDLLLASAAFASEGINMRKVKHAVAASAAALVSKNAHVCSPRGLCCMFLGSRLPLLVSATCS